jgi:hypothetical protein
MGIKYAFDLKLLHILIVSKEYFNFNCVLKKVKKECLNSAIVAHMYRKGN